MYGLTDKRLIDALIQAQHNGKKVRILLEHHPYKNEGENISSSNLLQDAHINLQWANPEFKLTHQKTLLLDQQDALVMTFNLTNSSFKKQRNFAVLITNPSTVQEIQTVFNSDWQHKNISVENPNLIWSPNNSREKLLDLIYHAKSAIKIYAQSLSDYKIIGALAKAARSGIKVQILTSSNNSTTHSKKFDYLTHAGVKIRFSKNYIIHAKVIMIDRQLAVVGSINLTKASIDDNRELAVITQDPKIIAELITTFNHDWDNAAGIATGRLPLRINATTIETLRKLWLAMSK